MQKISSKMKIYTILLTALLALSAISIKIQASTGYILINTGIAPSTPPDVPAGGTVDLNFTLVDWSGGQFILYFSKDGFSQISTGDIAYGPTFNVADLTALDTMVVSGYTIGLNGVSGPIPSAIAGGHYYVKAWDGGSAQVAVTDTYINVIGSLSVSPTWGPGGRSIEISGNAFSGNSYVNLSYTWDSTTTKIADFVSTDAIGAFVYAMSAPDLGDVITPVGSQLEDYTTLTFTAVDGVTKNTYTDTYDEYERGLLQVDTLTPPEGYLYGNATDFSGAITKGVMSEIVIKGNYFSPIANVTLWWDGTTQVGTVAANQTGYFACTIEVPLTSTGPHKIVINDAGMSNFYVIVSVVPSIVLTPEEGPVGTLVNVKGYGFAGRTSSVVYNVTMWWNNPSQPVCWALTDSTGYFETSFNVPQCLGGEHWVTPVQNDTDYEPAMFFVTPEIWVEPNPFENCDGIIKIMGTGIDPDSVYILYIDREFHMRIWAYEIPDGDSSSGIDEMGNMEVEFIAAGFDVGKHVVSLYEVDVFGGYRDLAAYSYFNVTGITMESKVDDILTMLEGMDAKITSINGNVVTMSTNLGTLSGTVLDVQGDVATIMTDLGVVKANVGSLGTAVADAKTAATDAKTAATSAQSTISGMSTPLWGAMILSLIAAIAAIFAVVLLQRKVAG